MISSGNILEPVHIIVEGALSQNKRGYSKPNEDYLVMDSENKLFIILDGVSRDVIDGKYPHPSPALDITKIFAEVTHASLIASKNNLAPKESLIHAAEQGNMAIEDYNSMSEWDFLPGTVGIISMIVDNKFYYVYVGDCSGHIVRKDSWKQFTFPQTRQVREHISMLSENEIRNVICNNKEHPYGYGVFTGDKRALNFLEFGEAMIYRGDTIILATDGMNNLFNSENFRFTQPITAKELIRKAEHLQEVNSFLRKDDKAVMTIGCK
jgi:serine/threonine protein phosphatase PrpC